MSFPVDSSVVLQLLVGLSLLYVLNIARLALFNPLRKIPGPFLSRFSGLYRLSLVAGGRAPQNYRQVHEQYGSIVRVGANHVSISDPAEIPTIYGLGSKFLKVTYPLIFRTCQLSPLDAVLFNNDPILQGPAYG